MESILFTAYGFSVSWAIANAIIGIGCGLVFQKSKSFIVRIISIILFAALGLIAAKTAIECVMYSIPVMVKLPKSIAAFTADSVVMIFGLVFYQRIRNHISQKESTKREKEEENSDER